MTRKRFVKLLMSMGYSRNEANGETIVVQHCGTTYEHMYINILLDEKNELCKFVEVAEKVLGDFGAGMIEFAKNLASAMAAITVCPAQINDAAIEQRRKEINEKLLFDKRAGACAADTEKRGQRHGLH